MAPRGWARFLANDNASRTQRDTRWRRGLLKRVRGGASHLPDRPGLCCGHPPCVDHRWLSGKRGLGPGHSWPLHPQALRTPPTAIPAMQRTPLAARGSQALPSPGWWACCCTQLALASASTARCRSLPGPGPGRGWTGRGAARASTPWPSKPNNPWRVMPPVRQRPRNEIRSTSTRSLRPRLSSERRYGSQYGTHWRPQSWQ